MHYYRLPLSQIRVAQECSHLTPNTTLVFLSLNTFISSSINDAPRVLGVDNEEAKLRETPAGKSDTTSQDDKVMPGLVNT